MLIHETYEVCKVRGYKAYKCACGRRVRRSKTFDQTINPWNTNENGEVKTRREIFNELYMERNAWMASGPEECTHNEKNAK